MICKNCGKEIDTNYYYGIKNSHKKLMAFKNKGIEIPESLLTTYKENHAVLLCGNCDGVLDYKDMPMEIFFNWLERSSEAGDPREISGKALIRYFELDKLLEPRKDAGD